MKEQDIKNMKMNFKNMLSEIDSFYKQKNCLLEYLKNNYNI